MTSFASRLIDITPPIARRCAALQAAGRGGLADAMIAATALELQMVVVTRNVGDFADAALEVIDPWQAPA